MLLLNSNQQDPANSSEDQAESMGEGTELLRTSHASRASMFLMVQPRRIPVGLTTRESDLAHSYWPGVNPALEARY